MEWFSNNIYCQINSNLFKEWGKLYRQGVVGFGFASHWLKNWHKTFKPNIKHTSYNRVITQNKMVSETSNLLIIHQIVR